MNNPCDRRPSIGTACARLFGTQYAKEHGKSPTRAEIMAHVEGEKYSAVHRSNLYWEAMNAARRTLENHPLYRRALAAEEKLEIAEKKLEQIQKLLGGKKKKKYQDIDRLVNAKLPDSITIN